MTIATLSGACFCGATIELSQPSGCPDSFDVTECPRCGQGWLVWVHGGVLASQVKVEPGMSWERAMYRIGVYGVRALVGQWESAEARAAFVSIWTARRRWEYETRAGRVFARLLSFRLVRWLNRPPLQLFERIYRHWFLPPHLQGLQVRLTPADRATIRRLNWARAS